MDAIVTHTELLSGVWGSEYHGSNHYSHTSIGRLRKKLGEYNDLLETVPGMEYSFTRRRFIDFCECEILIKPKPCGK